MHVAGTLLLEHYQEEDVILACTLPQDLTARSSTSVQPQLLEMDADSRFLLSRPLFHQDSESRLFKSQVLQAALCFCRDRGDAWRRQIKVTHHIFPPATQPQPKKASRDRSKSRTITKKSSSFMYTSKPRSDVPALSGPPCELLGVVAYGSAEPRVIPGTSGEIPQHPGDVRAICPQRPELERALSDSRAACSPSRELLGRALSDEQLLRTHRARQQQEKLRQHSSVISALTRQLRQARLVSSVADIQNRDLPAILKPPGEEIPYGRVADAVCSPLDDRDDENIYAEICDSPATNASRSSHSNKHKFKYLCLRSKSNVDTPTDDFYYVQLEGGNEAAYLNAIARLDTLTQEEEPAYDTVC
ncbi:hypothetical protein PR048_029676 [Dryococelus australis]|uniref:Uncharacterized protein n=1 Tax=Dryococelus australis TaxID=614101 RepID=A0ABQ9GE12_9NEOP|nr:hypothetical protein PR048_029676 [Dryococelus australis]